MGVPAGRTGRAYRGRWAGPESGQPARPRRGAPPRRGPVSCCRCSCPRDFRQGAGWRRGSWSPCPGDVRCSSARGCAPCVCGEGRPVPPGRCQGITSCALDLPAGVAAGGPCCRAQARSSSACSSANGGGSLRTGRDGRVGGRRRVSKQAGGPARWPGVRAVREIRVVGRHERVELKREQVQIRADGLGEVGRRAARPVRPGAYSAIMTWTSGPLRSRVDLLLLALGGADFDLPS